MIKIENFLLTFIQKYAIATIFAVNVFLVFYVLIDVWFNPVISNMLNVVCIILLAMLVSYSEMKEKEVFLSLRSKGMFLIGVVLVGIIFTGFLMYGSSFFYMITGFLFNELNFLNKLEYIILLPQKVIAIFLLGAGLFSISTNFLRISNANKKLLMGISGVALTVVFMLLERSRLWIFIFSSYREPGTVFNWAEWSFWAIFFYLVPGFVLAELLLYNLAKNKVKKDLASKASKR